MKIEISEENFSKAIRLIFKYYCFKTKQNNKILYNEKDDKYLYKFNYTEGMSCFNFCNLIKKEYPQYLNLNFLYSYFNFEFTKWDWICQKKREENPNFNIQLQIVFGKKALQSYLNKTGANDYYFHTNFYPKYRIELKDLIDLLAKNNLIEVEEETKEKKILKENELNPREELQKKKYYNETKGLYNCIQYTTLFKFTSSFCQNCFFKHQCKKILQNNYPRLYAKRFARFIIKKENERK